MRAARCWKITRIIIREVSCDVGLMKCVFVFCDVLSLMLSIWNIYQGLRMLQWMTLMIPLKLQNVPRGLSRKNVRHVCCVVHTSELTGWQSNFLSEHCQDVLQSPSIQKGRFLKEETWW